MHSPDIEEAVGWQVLYGDRIGTNLLELGAVREEALLKVLAEAHGLAPALPGPLTPPPAEVLRVLMLAFLKGAAPMIAVEVARRAIPAHSRPSFDEMEKNCKGASAPTE